MIFKDNILLKFNDKVNVPVEKDLPEFLKILVNQLLFRNSTYYVHNNRFQCQMSRRRSVLDIYRVTKHYKPEVKDEEVIKTLFNLCKKRYIDIGFCTSMRKLFFVPKNHYKSLSDFKKSALYYGWNVKDTAIKLRITEILKKYA